MTKREKEEFKKRMAEGRAKAKRRAGKSAPAKAKTKATKPKKSVTTRERNAPAESQRRTVTHRRGTSPAQAQNKNVTRRRSAKSGVSRRTARRNPDTAAEMYADFHGRKPSRTITYEENLNYRGDLAELGKLLELRFRTAAGVVTLENFGACQATCTPDGTNIYFVGGHQKVDLEALDIAGDKDYLELGECTYIAYFTKKGFHNFEPVDYRHKFGEVDGIRPVLAYDRQNKKLFLLGGNYLCEAAGIVN